MTLDQLRQYVILHPDYKEAWSAYLNRYADSLTASLNPALFQDSEDILQRKRREQIERAKTMDVKQMITNELEGCDGDILLDVLSLVRMLKGRPKLNQ